MTILTGYPLATPIPLDLVGYLGRGRFVILRPFEKEGRELPGTDWKKLSTAPACIPCYLDNNQVINFEGRLATLHDLNNSWHYQLCDGDAVLPLPPFTFFEIGDYK